MRPYALGLIAIVLQLLGAASALSAARITKTGGVVEVKARGAQVFSPVRSLPHTLRKEASVRTGPRAYALLEFDDRSRARLEEGSTFKVERASRIDNQLYLKLGHLRAWVRWSGRRRFRVRTPTAAVAVRGTKFSVRVRTDGGTVVRVIEGKVDVLDSKEELKRVEEGEFLETTRSGADGAPRKLDPLESELWDTTGRFGIVWTNWVVSTPDGYAVESKKDGLRWWTEEPVRVSPRETRRVADIELDSFGRQPHEECRSSILGARCGGRRGEAAESKHRGQKLFELACADAGTGRTLHERLLLLPEIGCVKVTAGIGRGDRRRGRILEALRRIVLSLRPADVVPKEHRSPGPSGPKVEEKDGSLPSAPLLR